MTLTEEQQDVETSFTQADIDRMWELFFGKRYSAGRIALEYGTTSQRIVGVIDSESGRRWRKNHPHETNRERLLSE